MIANSQTHTMIAFYPYWFISSAIVQFPLYFILNLCVSVHRVQPIEGSHRNSLATEHLAPAAVGTPGTVQRQVNLSSPLNSAAHQE